MKTAELHELTQGELEAKAVALEKDLFKLKFQHGIRQLENTAKLSMLKKDIARVNTVLTMKQKNA